MRKRLSKASFFVLLLVFYRRHEFTTSKAKAYENSQIVGALKSDFRENLSYNDLEGRQKGELRRDFSSLSALVNDLD